MTIVRYKRDAVWFRARMCNYRHYIYVLRQLQEEFEAEKKDLYFAFVNLEDTFHRVPRDVALRALRNIVVEVWFVRSIYLMYRNAKSHGGMPSSFSNDIRSTEDYVMLCAIW